MPISALTPLDPDIEKTWVDKRLIGLRGTDVWIMIKVKVNLVRQGRTLELEMPEGSRVRDLIKRLGYPTTGVVVTRDSRPLLEDEVLTEGELNLFQVASGG